MTADGLLDDLLASGTAQEAEPKDGIRRAVRVGQFEVGATSKPSEKAMHARWKRRVGTSALEFLLIADAPGDAGSLLVLGPLHEAPVRAIAPEVLSRVLERAHAEPDGLRATRRLASDLARADRSDIPGLVVRGLLTVHTLDRRFRQAPKRWEEARRAVEGLDGSSTGDWRAILDGFGYRRTTLPESGYLVSHGEKRVAVAHPSPDPAAFARLDDNGRPPEGRLLAACAKHEAPFGLLVAEGVFRLFAAGSPAEVSEWIEMDAEALGVDGLPWLALLSPPLLAEGGFADLREADRNYGVELWKRLGQRIRNDSLPALAEGLDRWAARFDFDTRDDAKRRDLEQASLTLLFRLIFILYAESAGYLPVHNHAYRARSLTTLVREAAEKDRDDAERTSELWSRAASLVAAMRQGDEDAGIAAYNGALFATDKLPGAGLIEDMQLDDACFRRVLVSLGRERDRGVDYSTLEIGHLGNIYESLLSQRLSLADRPVRYDPRSDRYLWAEFAESDAACLLWQTHEGGRKAGGVYYTPTPLVRHLVDGAVRPAFREHLDRVEQVAIHDPARAAVDLLDFAVVDPACGSGHFLVEVLDLLAAETARFLAKRPLSRIRDELASLRESAAGAESVEDMTLLRRLLLKHCVFGVDVSPMGVETATMSLWLAAFVPGLSLSYLGANLRVGDSLIGVGDRNTVVARETFRGKFLEKQLIEAAEKAARAAGVEDKNPEEYAKSEKEYRGVQEHLDGLRRVFDLWTAEPFGQQGSRRLLKGRADEIAAGQTDPATALHVSKAQEVARKHRFFHWPLEFPQVFREPRRGFDAVVGNPPWEEVTVEELGFFALYVPGLVSMTENEREVQLTEFCGRRPDVAKRLREEQQRAAAVRLAFAAGEYRSTPGDPDLYKFFCQRYPTLLRDGGSMGVVLPRTAFNAKGSAGFREWLFERATVGRVDFLVNEKQWMFETAPRYSVALVSARKAPPPSGHRVEVVGTAASLAAWRSQADAPGLELSESAFGPGRQIPLLRSSRETDLLARIRLGSPFPLGSGGRWKCFAVAELHETNDRNLWKDAAGDCQLWKGASFGQFDPHGRQVRPCAASPALLKKVYKRNPGRGQRLRSISTASRRAAVRRELDRARVAFHDVARGSDPRTVIACLAPPRVFLTNTAPYLAFAQGRPRDQAGCLGILNSLPFDWQARRFVEIHLNFFILEGLVVPDLDDEDYEAVAEAAARLSAVDHRFADFAEAAGVACGPLDDGERQRLRIEIDARVARGWGLDADDLSVLFEDFTARAVPPAYREALTARLGELS